MTKKTKSFDCVKMKVQAQEELRAEYERRKKEFSSYSDFLAAKIEENPQMKQFWDKISKKLGKVSA